MSSLEPLSKDRVANFYKTESHCELCIQRQSGCPYQYDSEDCYDKREHFSMLRADR
jgi:hypothetical protein